MNTVALVLFVLTGGVAYASRFFGVFWARAVCGVFAAGLAIASIWTLLNPSSPQIETVMGAEAVLTQPGNVDWQREVSRASSSPIDRVYNQFLPPTECSYDRFNPPFAHAFVELDNDPDTQELLWMWDYTSPCEGYGSNWFCGANMCEAGVFRLRDQGVERLLEIYSNQMEIGRGTSNGMRDLVVGGNRIMQFNGAQYTF